ncbi:MAG: hypothetical protein KVP17_003272 [Porospora cf. gigantea B]|nr:MAG: hypothetical protein KVP17_003272 [Porospora cf. gigantea B]
MKAEEDRRLRRIEKEKVAAEEKLRTREDDGKRDDLTVLIMNLSLKASERDVWRFLTEKAGKVADIQLIKDARSGKSKGVAYVEFYEQASVLRAISLGSGAMIMGQRVVIQASQAEKNRAAKVAKQQAAEMLSGNGPLKIYVGGLVDTLSTITEAELMQLFEPFGEILSVDVHKDPYTAKNKGYAFIHYRQASDARDSIMAMNGFEIAGRTLKVGHATESHSGGPSSYDQAHANLVLQHGGQLTETDNATFLPAAQNLDRIVEDRDYGFIQGGAKFALMQKLQQRQDAKDVL